jgi:hypothetical protein
VASTGTAIVGAVISEPKVTQALGARLQPDLTHPPPTVSGG